jgi:geranylgeranyl diphosphate synthase type I
MAFLEYSSLFMPAVEQELHRVVDSAFMPECDDLHTMLAYHLGFPSNGLKPTLAGKRIRPILLLLCTAAMDHPWISALPAAAAVELIHNFSLIHDDIEDNSPLRRGRPTIWSRWGVAKAINAGDAMFSLAQTAIIDLQLTTTPAVA